MSEEAAPEEEEEIDTSHLDDMEDGCGCAEVWEHLSEGRDGDADADAAADD
ncbi:hypothetical protein [Haloglomus irregulare]|jgi:hypothetical protein|uniref:hypothetical protein n=1 Tax=Haloglomus irregulare TaxID=2234134 RepID=UPI00163D7449|nr:hypothetical protein [Haloglomus irregulare]